MLKARAPLEPQDRIVAAITTVSTATVLSQLAAVIAAAVTGVLNKFRPLVQADRIQPSFWVEFQGTR